MQQRQPYRRFHQHCSIAPHVRHHAAALKIIPKFTCRGNFNFPARVGGWVGREGDEGMVTNMVIRLAVMCTLIANFLTCVQSESGILLDSRFRILPSWANYLTYTDMSG
jgi:hypothetical protein